MNKKNLELLNDFANSTSIAKGGNILITENGTHFTPLDSNKTSMKYEDCNLLYDLIKGAKHFLYFLERNNYEIKRKKRMDKKT